MGRAKTSERPSTPIAIIDAAERLFGDFGIEGISIRQIGLEAKVGNKSAVSYHFGDRADLVVAIWNYRLPVLEVRRREMMAAIHAEGRVGDLHSVVAALVLPNYELVDAQGRRRYVAFFRSAMRWSVGRDLRQREMGQTPSSGEAMALIALALPDLTADLLTYRIRNATDAFMDMVIDRDREIAAGEPVLPEGEFLAEGIDMIVAILRRPPPVARPAGE